MFSDFGKKGEISIPEFYAGKSIFITGGSGFLGKVLIEKLLRSCPGIKNIYILVRYKKGKTPQERLQQILDVPLFDLLKSQNRSALEKVIPVTGDVTQLRLGLDENDRELLINNVSIIFHVAASVRFDDFLKKAILCNTRGTREVIDLAKELKKIDVFVHVSTAYCNCNYNVIDEHLYPPLCDWRKAIETAENVDENILEVMSQKYIEPLPNTYTFTKLMAEHVVNDLCKDKIPTVIFRPSIVLPSFNEPETGWIDNFNGPLSIKMASAAGILRVLYCDPEVYLDYVYVDNVAKSLIISSWQKGLENKHKEQEIAFYNCASDMVVRIDHMQNLNSVVYVNPLKEMMWVSKLKIVKNFLYFFVCMMCFQILPALLFDGLLKLLGKKPRLLRLQRKVYISSMALATFMRNTWTFKTKNYVGLEEKLLETDKKSFSFLNNRVPNDEVSIVNKLGEIYKSCKIYLMNDTKLPTPETLEKYRKWYILDISLKLLFWEYVIYVVFWKINIISLIYEATYNYFDRL